MHRKAVFVLVCVALVGMVWAEDPGTDESTTKAVLVLIDKGKAEVQAGRAQHAITHLQQAIHLLQAATRKGLAAFLPAVPKGWKADEPDSQSGSFGSGKDTIQWSLVQRTYRQENGEDDYDVQLTDSPQLVEGQRAAIEMFKNPEMRKMMEASGDTKFEVIEADGWAGTITSPNDSDTNLLAIHGSVLVTISGKDMALVKALWEAMDRKGLAGAKK